MLAKLVVNCRLSELARVGQYMLDTGLSSNNTYYRDDPVQVHGDYVLYFSDELEQVKALEMLRVSPGVGSCELKF